MANTLTLNNPVPATLPADGWIVGYKILGDPGAFTVVGPFVAMPINIPTADPVGTLYEGYIQRDCGALTSTFLFWETPCDCVNAGPGYVLAPDGVRCELNETTAPTITNSGFCLAPNPQQPNYSVLGTRIYNVGATPATVAIPFATPDAFINSEITTAPYWRQSPASLLNGPMNRAAVWIDSDCNGSADPLTIGAQTTISFQYINPGPAKTVFVGVGGDNQFEIIVNGASIIDTTPNGVIGNHFNIFHIFPATMVTGPNLINIVGTADGFTNDAIAMNVYDNSIAQLQAADDDGDLTILFTTQSLFGQSFDVATCPPTYSLDSTGGSGNYICRRTTYADCNQLP